MSYRFIWLTIIIQQALKGRAQNFWNHHPKHGTFLFMFAEHFATQCHAAQGYLSLIRFYEFIDHLYFIYLVFFSQNKNRDLNFAACCKNLRFLALFWKILGVWNTVMIQTVLHCLSSIIFKAFNRHFALTINFQLNDPALWSKLYRNIYIDILCK